MTKVRVHYDDLYHYSLEILKKAGVPQEDARIIADSLTLADIRGVNTHGAFHLPKYVARIKAGSLNAATNISIIKQTSSATLVDGGGGFGHVAGHHAMRLAMEKAKQSGIGLTLVKNSNHFGATSYFSMLAINENQIGIAMTNSSPTIAPTGGIMPLLGNNPIAVAVPAGEYAPPVLDIAFSVSSLSKIKQAADKGLEIPLGWATDKDGVVTTDANEAVKGLLLPVGGYKGYGIILIIDMICGVLSGAGFGPGVGKHIQNPGQNASPQNLGHAFIAINVETFMELSSFKSRVDQYLEALKTSDKAKDVEDIYYPGEKEYLTKTRQSKEGISFEKIVIDELVKVGQELGVAMKLPVHNCQ